MGLPWRHTPAVTDIAARDRRLKQWERRTATPLLVLAVLFLFLLTVPVVDRHLPRVARDGLRVADVLIWLAFTVDYVVRLRLVVQRKRLVLSHLPDLAMIALPALRPLRILRLMSLTHSMARRSAGTVLVDTSRAVAASAVLVVYLGAVGVLDSERDAHGANITSFGDALWWASTTITTVGYGDRYPVTTQGRVIAVGLMIVGIGLLGLLTAGFAAWFVRQATEAAAERAVRDVVDAVGEAAREEASSQRAITAELDDVLAVVAALQHDLQRIAERAK